MQKYQRLHPRSDCPSLYESLSKGYSVLAKEYYTPLLHPTCHNFREASKIVLQQLLSSRPLEDDYILDVGAGYSLAAEMMQEMSIPLDKLAISDASAEMLSHSEIWKSDGAKLLVSEAENLPISANTFSLIIASLGDPYNTLPCWQEFYRVLQPGGLVVFTTPAYELATLFRGKNNNKDYFCAEFTLQNKHKIQVPSWIFSEEEQICLIEQVGLKVESVVSIGLSQIGSNHISPKLLFEELVHRGIVTGYLVSKPSRHQSSVN